MTAGQRIKFGSFEADLKTCELFRRGTKIPVQQKPFQILAILLQHPGELVTRDELHQLLWPDTFVQRDLSLNTAIRKLRLALSDTGAKRQYVETVGSRGYRFTQQVIVPDGALASIPETHARHLRLAVLPFDNLSGPEHERFSDGLTEQLIARLGRMSEAVSVIAPVSSMQYKRTGKSAAQICHELRCDNILSGSVVHSNERVRVTAKLLRGNDQSCIWTDSFASEQSDILTIQDEIATQIARALHTVLPVRRHTHDFRSSNPRTSAKYLQATALASQWIERGFQTAAALLREVISADPDFAPAHADMAQLHAIAAPFGLMRADEMARVVEEHARAALSTSDMLEAAHVALGYKSFYYDADWMRAEESFRRAISINPSCAIAYAGHSQLLTATGDVDAGISRMLEAHDLDPVSPFVATQLGCAYYFANDHDKAEAALREGINLHPNFSIALASLSWVQVAMEQFARALDSARRAHELDDSPVIAANYAYVLARAGDTRNARIELDKLRNSKRDFFPAYWLALVHAALGEESAAVTMLDRCMQQRCSWRVLLKVDPKVQPLKGTERYQQYVRELAFRSLRNRVDVGRGASQNPSGSS